MFSRSYNSRKRELHHFPSEYLSPQFSTISRGEKLGSSASCLNDLPEGDVMSHDTRSLREKARNALRPATETLNSCGKW